MDLTIPDEIVQRAELTAGEARLAIAVQLYTDNRVDHTDACRLAGVPPAALNRELLRLGLGVQQYPPGGGAGERRAV
jgi:predicted HTH domain antitoxin